MENDIKSKLEEEIQRELEKLSTLDPGSKEHKDAADTLVTLYKLNIEETEAERSFMKKCDHERIEERELSLKNAQLEEQVKDRYFRLGIEAAAIVLPLIFYATWMRRGFKFEETGAFTSTTFRGLFSKFKPTKR